jgi:hypothetical protein
VNNLKAVIHFVGGGSATVEELKSVVTNGMQGIVKTLDPEHLNEFLLVDAYSYSFNGRNTVVAFGPRINHVSFV